MSLVECHAMLTLAFRLKARGKSAPKKKKGPPGTYLVHPGRGQDTNNLCLQRSKPPERSVKAT